MSLAIIDHVTGYLSILFIELPRYCTWKTVLQWL